MEEQIVQLSELFMRMEKDVEKSVDLVKETCTQDEFLCYKELLSQMLTDLLVDAMNPISRLCPEIVPDFIKGTA